MRQSHKIAGTGLCILLLIVSGKVPCLGKGEASLSLSSMEYTKDGGQISLDINKDGSINVEYNAAGMDTGYYTAYLYTRQIPSGKTVSSVNTMQIGMTADTPVQMNINIITATGVTHKCVDDAVIYIKKKEAAYYEPVTVNNGTFTIEAGFDGLLYIPYKSFYKDRDEKETVTAIGVTTTIEQLGKSSFVIHCINYGIEQEFETIWGSENVYIPSAGEFQYQYNASGADGIYTLEEQQDGISITEEGLLTVEEGFLGENVIIIYQTDNLTYGYPVSLQMTTGIPAKGELPDYGASEKMKEARKQWMYWIRAAGVLAATCYAIFYAIRVRKGLD